LRVEMRNCDAFIGALGQQCSEDAPRTAGAVHNGRSLKIGV
jgi:hypothetical protein